jgi:DNA-binding MarR family transcriptional regulator
MKQRKLTNPQNELLKLLYKFRYANSKLLSSHRNKNIATINKALAILLKNKYIDRNYNQSYKLAGRGAEYYLTNTGIRYLRDTYQLNEAVLHSMYKNKSIGQPFVQKCLLIYQTYIKLQKQYGSSLTILTKAEMAGTDGFPEPLPDLYFYSESAEYLLDLFTDNLFYLVKKRIDQLIEHYESGDWPEKDYPTLLLVFPDSRIEAKAQTYIEKVKDDNYIEDAELTILTTTQKALFVGAENAIWSNSTDKIPRHLS